MTDRKIVVRDCKDCPRLDHKGGFGNISHIPVCRETQRELPYSIGKGFGSMVVATREIGIPDWCPLPRNTEGGL